MTPRPRKADAPSCVAAILDGRFDGQLADVQRALRDRILSTATKMRWKVTYEDLTVTEDDLTLGEAELVEDLANQTWDQIDPYSSAKECLAIVAVCLHKRRGVALDEAHRTVSALPVARAAELLDIYEVQSGPLEIAPGGSEASTAAA